MRSLQTAAGGGSAGVAGLGAAGLLRALRDRLQPGLRADPVADDGRGAAGQGARPGRLGGHGSQLVVHLPGHQDVSTAGAGARHPRRLLPLRRHVRARHPLRLCLRPRDSRTLPRRHREESHRTPRPAHEQHS